MKFNKFLIGLAALAISAIHLQALDTFNSFSGGGTAINPGTNYLILPGEGLAPLENGSVGSAVVNFLAYRGFSANAITLQSYYSTNKTFLVSSNSLGANNGVIFTGTTTNYVVLKTVTATATNTFIPGTNGFTAGSVCVLYHVLAPDWRVANEYLTISSMASSTITTTNAVGTVETLQPVVYNQTPSYAVSDGDELFLETAGALISVPSSATTVNTLIGAGIVSGGKSKPFLLVISSAGAGTNTIDAANAVAQ